MKYCITHTDGNIANTLFDHDVGGEKREKACILRCSETLIKQLRHADVII